jgi:hypothetical protein
VAHPHRTDDNSDICSLADDARFGALHVSDASHDFGAGAIEVSCPCGAWVIEDESGRAIARSELVIASLAWRELAGAA